MEMIETYTMDTIGSLYSYLFFGFITLEINPYMKGAGIYPNALYEKSATAFAEPLRLYGTD